MPRSPLVRLALLLALGLLLDPAGAEGQRPRRGRPPMQGGAGFFTVGAQWLDLDGLNQQLVAAGYPAFGEDVLALGGSGHGFHQRLLLGGSGQALLSPSETSLDGAFRSRLSGGYGHFDLGYAIVAAPRARLYPMLGIGGGATRLEITERSSPGFDEVLRSPRRGARLTRGSFILDTSLGLDVRVTARRRENGVGGFAIGVRGGYTFTPLQTEWHLDESSDVAGGPDAGLQGPYVRLMLGGWGERPARR
jgi:hypothetical protein